VENVPVHTVSDTYGGELYIKYPVSKQHLDLKKRRILLQASNDLCYFTLVCMVFLSSLKLWVFVLLPVIPLTGLYHILIKVLYKTDRSII
jgi:hypothetical protein